MLKQALAVLKNAASFLQTGVCPPETPRELQRHYADKNHFSSKKFFLAFSGFFILAAFYISAVGVLYWFKDSGELLNSYALVFSKTIEVFTVVMSVYLGGQAMVDLRYSSSSSHASEYKKEVQEITERIIGNEKEEDYTLELQHDHET